MWDLAAAPLTGLGASGIAIGWCMTPWYGAGGPSACQPSCSKKRTFGTWIWATIVCPPRSPAVATAKRTSSAPSWRTRASGSTASRSPFHSPSPSSGYSRTAPATAPSATPTTCSVSGGQSRSSRSLPANSAWSTTKTRRRTAKCASSSSGPLGEPAVGR